VVYGAKLVVPVTVIFCGVSVVTIVEIIVVGCRSVSVCTTVEYIVEYIGLAVVT
jgi:hypothetical protein